MKLPIQALAGGRIVRIMRRRPSTVPPLRPVMQRARKLLDANLLPVRHESLVAARLQDVNLTRKRPRAVLVQLRLHPQGGPQPVARWQLGADLDASVLEGESAGCGEAGALHGRRNCVGGAVALASACATGGGERCVRTQSGLFTDASTVFYVKRFTYDLVFTGLSI